MRFPARAKTLLGIAISERSLLVAQGCTAGREAEAPIVAQFKLPADLSFDQPEALGAAFAAFIIEKRFTARMAVVGIPAKQLVSLAVDVPPTDTRTAKQLMWVQASSRFSDELGPLAIDFIGSPSTQNASSVELIGLQRSYLDRITAFAFSAGITVKSVTSTALTLAAAVGPHVNDALCVCIRADGVEVAINNGSEPRAVKHIASTAVLPRLLAELRRNAAVSSSKHTGLGKRKLVLWDELGLDAGSTDAISQAVDLPLVTGDVKWLDVAAQPSVGASALALLIQTRGEQSALADFLRPRIAAPQTRTVSHRTLGIGGAIAAMMFVVIAGYAHVLQIQRQIDATRRQLDALAPQLETARPFVARMEFAKTFQSRQPNYLACLRDFTAALPQQGQTYLTSFMLQANMTGSCVGHSPSDQDVLDLLDKLNATGRFASLNRKLDSHARGSAADVMFTVAFTYLPGKQTN